jgi:uncharacterized membrane protein YeaQ/YmgE (transglycosylase-associated protein family)
VSPVDPLGPASQPPDTRASSLGCLTVFGATIVGAVVGGLIGNAHDNPNDTILPHFGLTVGVILGAGIGLVTVLLIVGLVRLRSRFRHRREIGRAAGGWKPSLRKTDDDERRS